MVVPPRLKKGDTVALISPSSPLAADQPVEAVAAAVEKLGYRVWIGDSCRGAADCGYAAATAEVRVRDLHHAFSDPDINGIWCTRGGSTAWQLLPHLDFELIAANPKVFIGFSDITTLHMAFQQRCGFVTYHGPNANQTLKWNTNGAFSWRSLSGILETDASVLIENPEGEQIVGLCPGQAAGRLAGGNLSLVTASIGTPWQIEAKDRILFLEDVGEDVYALDRMLHQLKYSGVLDEAAGIVLGAFTNCGNTYDKEYGPGELMQNFFADYPKPILYNVRSAHCEPMVTLPMGRWCKIDGTERTMVLHDCP